MFIHACITDTTLATELIIWINFTVSHSIFKNVVLHFPLDDEIHSQQSNGTTQPLDANLNPAIPHPNRYTQSPHQSTQSNIHTAISQPYGTESSNFGPFYHHHNHMPSYGNPYDKFKIPSNAHSRSTSSPYGSFQGFYGNPHQLGRPNGYIDLVPRWI